MAISSAKPTRSISLPTRLHPNSQKIAVQLNKLKTNWELPFSLRETPLGSEAIRSRLADLVELFNSTKQLISQSPLTQQVLTQHSSMKALEETLDGSIALLDACVAARELLLRTKENAQLLHSSLRRKANRDSNVENDIYAYMSFRKNDKREIAKRLRGLKAIQSNVDQAILLASLHEDHSLQMVITVMRELSFVAISIFRCLFTFLSLPVTKTKASTGWSLISKLVMTKTVEKGHKNIFNEVGTVDISLSSLREQLRKNNNCATIIGLDITKKRLEALCGCVEGLEAGLECLFKCLIHHRVSLLNLLTP